MSDHPVAVAFFILGFIAQTVGVGQLAWSSRKVARAQQTPMISHEDGGGIRFSDDIVNVLAEVQKQPIYALILLGFGITAEFVGSLTAL